MCVPHLNAIAEAEKTLASLRIAFDAGCNVIIIKKSRASTKVVQPPIVLCNCRNVINVKLAFVYPVPNAVPISKAIWPSREILEHLANA